MNVESYVNPNLNSLCQKEFHSTLALCTKKNPTRDGMFNDTGEMPLDEDGWGKVKRLCGYLKGTLNMSLIHLANCLQHLRLWVDMAYVVYNDWQGHTGAGTSFRQEMVMIYS